MEMCLDHSNDILELSATLVRRWIGILSSSFYMRKTSGSPIYPGHKLEALAPSSKMSSKLEMRHFILWSELLLINNLSEIAKPATYPSTVLVIHCKASITGNNFLLE